eukprot:scaffold43352_cov70-Phaeocystis_antarctica.AAC.3
MHTRGARDRRDLVHIGSTVDRTALFWMTDLTKNKVATCVGPLAGFAPESAPAPAYTSVRPRPAACYVAPDTYVAPGHVTRSGEAYSGHFALRRRI